MSKGRRIGAVLAATAMAIGMAMTVGTAPATAAPKKFKGPQPVSQLLQRVDDNDSTWVDVWFRTDKKACNFRLSVWDNNLVDIYHPQGSYTSLRQNDTLNRNERDYASFRVDVDDVSRSSATLLFAQMTWRWCGTGKWQRQSTAFVLPIRNDS